MKISNLIILPILVASISCGKGEDSKDGDAESDGNGNSKVKVGDISLGDNPLSSLKLSQSITASIPASVTATVKGATLVNGTKSREACMIRQKIKEAKMNEEQMAMDLCFIESQKSMKLGGKYKMTFSPPSGGAMPLIQPPPPGDSGGDMSGGDMSGGDTPGADMPGGDMGEDMVMSVFLDDSDKDQLKIFMCTNDKLTQKIVIDSASKKGSKGRYKAKFDFSGNTVAIQGAFDNGVTAPDRQISNSKLQFAFSFGESKMTARSNMLLNLSETGVSIVKVANESSMSESDFSAADKEIGVAFIGPKFGSALFQRTFTGSGSFDPGDQGPPTEPGFQDPSDSFALIEEQQVETSRAYFDSKGLKVEASASALFAAQGALEVTESHFPQLLPTDFNVTFDDTDWDCSGTVALEMDTSSDAFESCQGDFTSPFSEESCDDNAFALGMEAEGIEAIENDGEFEDIFAGEDPFADQDMPPELPPELR